MKKLPRRPAVLMALLLLVGPAHAGDGVLEINQTCAVQTGCFAGDAAGFPVTITQSGSYVLTGNLNGFTAEAVHINAHDVTVDLGGFAIIGPGTCSGTPPSCSGAGSTVGVDTETTLFPIRHGLTVRNGHIRGVDIGVRLGIASIVEDLTFRDVASAAIAALNGCRIARNAIYNAGNDGIVALFPGCLISDNAIYNVADVALSTGADSGYTDNVISNAGTGLSGGGHALGNNLCNDALCRAPVQRRFYSTHPTNYHGASAATACADGFHMASLWEIKEPSGLSWDPDLGVTGGDLGSGPISGGGSGLGGWVRTGSGLDGGATLGPGLDNCDGYTSSSSTNDGTVVALSPAWDNASPDESATWGWSAWSAACNSYHPVWCVQDE